MLILIWAQSVLGSQMPVHIILGVLSGQHLSSDPSLATLPISVTMLTAMFAAPTLSAIMGRWGRRTGFIIGTAAGTAGALLAAHALRIESFALFCVASGGFGIYMGAHVFYRFAATDIASPAFQPKAISWVMAGGLASAILGPEIAKQFEDLLAPVPYAGAYQVVALVNLIGVIPIFFLKIPLPPRRDPKAPKGRAWSKILADPAIVVAMLCAMVAYALMNLVMTASPLAMQAVGFGTGDAADVVRFHILAMFAPSFFTGALISRFGAPRIIALGLAILAGCAIVAVSGVTFTHFALALALLGVGWNFGFIGATALLAGAHRPEEQSRIQGFNDFMVLGLVTVASFGSGALMNSVGWNAVNLAMLPALAIAALALGWLVLRVRQSPLGGA